MAALLVSIMLGVGLYAAPDTLGYDGAVRVSHLITGAIAASVSLIAIADVAREARWINLFLGAWLVLSVPLLEHEPVGLGVGVAVGMSLTLLAVVRGPINQRLGGGWRAVLDPNVLDPNANITEQQEGGSNEPRE